MIFYLLLFISSFLLTFVVKWFAEKKSLIDIPNERSSHAIPTPRGGGIAIALTWFMGITYLFYCNKIDKALYYALMSGILISGISLIDDIYNLKTFPRLLIQAMATFSALYFIGGLQRIDFGIYIFENKILLTALAFIGIMWFVNLYNFIDGIDGYAASEAIFVALSMLILSGSNLFLVLALAVLGFIPWNWDKAKIFMGDVGSTLLGFTLAVLAVYYQNNNSFSIIIWLILTSLFWFDATLTIIRRFKNKEKLSQAHKKHAYQRITQAGFSHQKTVFFSILINLILFSFAFFAKSNPLYVLCSFILSVSILFLINKYVDFKMPFK